MKSILYVGATLMIGASIYGFVDYKQTSHKKEFKSLYTVETVKEPPVAMTDDKTDPVVKKEIITMREKPVSRKQDLKETTTIAPVKPIAEDEKMNPGETKKIEEVAVAVNPSANNKVIRKAKKKKLNSKLFSRAPLREEMEEVNVETLRKADAKKTEKKER